MAQPKEMKQDANGNGMIDVTQEYRANAIVYTVGRAIAIDLNQCMLPGNAKNKHMTIMFRKSPKWTSNEIELVSKETDNWVKQKYGSVQTSVTFCIENWGKRSVKILGDLNELCLHLRATFNSMTDDKKPRIPHVELFTNGPGGKGRGRGRGRKVKDDTCRICGELGHFKKHCPNKDKKHNGKKQGKRNSVNCGGNTDKFKEKLGKMIVKMQELKSQKNSEILLLDEEEKQFEALLANCDNLDIKTLRNEIKNIAKTFKIKRKEMKLRRKSFKRRGRGRGRGRGKRKEENNNNKLDKQKRKELNKKRKESRKLEKAEKQKLKKEKLEKLSLARLDNLPLLTTEIGNKSILNIYIDGYNIIGCDSICRKSMRGKGGGMKKSRQRLTKLLQENFLNKIKNEELKFNYNININLWFDGNGKNEKYKDIEITFSTKKQIVDDKLVELFSKNNKTENKNILVITTDKELTLRLYEIGVKVIKSSTFYKTYLKGNNNDNDDDEKKEEDNDNDNAPDIINDEDNFVQIMANKLNYNKFSEGDGGSFDDEYDDCDYNTPHQKEGNDKIGEDTPDEDDDDDYYYDDYEFTSIFGENMDLVHSD